MEYVEFERVKYMTYMYTHPYTGEQLQVSWHDNGRTLAMMADNIKRLLADIETQKETIQSARRDILANRDYHNQRRHDLVLRWRNVSRLQGDDLTLSKMAEREIISLGGPTGVQKVMVNHIVEAINSATVDQIKADSNGTFEIRLSKDDTRNFSCFAFLKKDDVSLSWLVPVKADPLIETGYRDVRMDLENSMNFENLQEKMKAAALNSGFAAWLNAI